MLKQLANLSKDKDDDSMSPQEIQKMEEVKVLECASAMKAIKLPHDSKLPNQFGDWSAYKSGKRNRFTYFTMEGENHDEYTITLALPNPVEMRSFVIGFNNVVSEFYDHVPGIPSNILLEGGLYAKDIRPFGTLCAINDDTYNACYVKVFSKNFNTLG